MFFNLVLTNAAPLPGLTCKEFDNLPQPIVVVENHAVFDVACVRHVRCLGLGF